jgi:threonine dehydrogenase-like Zn-dependent dehydrogenase
VCCLFVLDLKSDLLTREIVERGIRLIGNGQAPVQKYWEQLLKMIQSDEIDPLKMVSHRVVVDDFKSRLWG